MEVHFPGTASRYNSTHSPSASSPTTRKGLLSSYLNSTQAHLTLTTNTDYFSYYYFSYYEIESLNSTSKQVRTRRNPASKRKRCKCYQVKIPVRLYISSRSRCCWRRSGEAKGKGALRKQRQDLLLFMCSRELQELQDKEISNVIG